MSYTIPFNKPCIVGTEQQYLDLIFRDDKFSGDGPFTQRCQTWLQRKLNSPSVLMTPSCTAALEMCALLLDIQPGDEVIMPSYTFSSTATAFALRGAHIVFVDIRPDTLNIDEAVIESAITEKTKVIVVVHYAGVGCEMDRIMTLAEKHSIYVVEDAAQALMSSYKEKMLGSVGHLATFSFHETKNYSCGEGGALVINAPEFQDRAEIIREKGTNRKAFIDGRVDKYSWVDIGSSYLPSELQSAFLMAQLDAADTINNDRLKTWNLYNAELRELTAKGDITSPDVPEECRHNGHIFHIKVEDQETRSEFLNHCRRNGVYAIFHYVPLHSSTAGEKFSVFRGEDVHTTKESQRIVRLPLYYGMTVPEIDAVLKAVKTFF